MGLKVTEYLIVIKHFIKWKLRFYNNIVPAFTLIVISIIKKNKSWQGLGTLEQCNMQRDNYYKLYK